MKSGLIHNRTKPRERSERDALTDESTKVYPKNQCINRGEYMTELINDILEMFYNETDDYDEIADRFDIDIMTIANIINDNIE